MCLHAAHNSEWATKQIGRDLAPTGMRGKFVEDHLPSSDHKAGEGSENEVTVVHVQRLKPEREDEDEGAGEES
jgi:hypothetical protein